MFELISRYQYGFVCIPVFFACKEKGLFDLVKQKKIIHQQIAKTLGANTGHLQVALKMMQSLGLLSKNEIGEYSLADNFQAYCSIPEEILELYNLPIESYLLGKEKPDILKSWIGLSQQQWHINDRTIADFLDGVLIIPIMLGLHKHNLLGVDEEKPLFSGVSPHIREELSTLFIAKGWAEKSSITVQQHSQKLIDNENNLCLTAPGKFIVERILMTGVTSSYTPMLLQISDVLFGDCQTVFGRDKQGSESHIDRKLNVMSSGFQHQKFFADVDELILTIFNQLPYGEQPNYIVDMGCGDGTLLKRVYEVISTKSARGKVLDKYPVQMIGVDYNEASLQESALTLAGIPNLLMKGDIGNPQQMISDLITQGIDGPEKILHIRSFLDHDRPFIPPQNLEAAKRRSQLCYQGVYVDSDGGLIPAHMMVQSLVEHLERWSGVVTKHGMMILEVHCLEPKVVNKFLDSSNSLHFDALQAFLSQYLVEADVFLMCAAEVGLFPKWEFSKRYPQNFPFSRITLNCFEKKPYKLRHPTMKNLPDLIALEALCWSENLRVDHEEIQRRIGNFPQGQLILEIEEKIVGAIYSQRIAQTELLDNKTCIQVPLLHTESGVVVQLLAVNILPEFQNQRLGDQLLEFMLQYCAYRGGVERVVAVTLCRNYPEYSPMPMAEYIHKKNESGLLVDQTLRFHQMHGAKIQKVLPGYRPKDLENQGCGVLIEYDIYNRNNLDIVGAKQRYTWVKGQRVQLADIEKALLSAPGVEEAYVLAHQTLLVAYVVVAGVWNPQQLNSQMQQQLPPWMMPGAYVPLSSLPLTHKGKVDEVALGRFPVIDDNVVQRWEAKLKAVPEIEEVAVVVQQKQLKLPPLHISDLLPSAQMKLPNHGATPVVEKSSPTTELQSQSKSGKQAISEGGPIKWPANAPTTLAQALERAAQEHGETSLRYIHSDGEVSTQTYSELWVEAQRILGGLRELGLKPQAQVIFQLESNQDFISAFWGCVLGGFVPVPVSIPPSYDQSNSGLTKLQNTWGLLGQPLVLTDRKLAPSVSRWSQRLNLGKFELQTIEKLRSSEIDRNWYNSQPEDVAMLLLTSGSTGIPKAVMQSHRSLLSRSAATAQMNDFSCEEISLNWFPLDHVGGIVMFQIRDVYLGCQQIHVPTQEILQTPTRWLDLMSQYRTTITWAPNFAYGLIIDQLEQQDKIGSENPQWDLSSLKFILNGGEAIVGKTARKFGELLSRYHLPPQAMHPAWGMSETSSAVTFSNKFWLDSTDNGQKFVEVGSPIPGFAIRIVDNQNQIVSEEIIGRVQVKGPSVTSGYYQNPTANQEAFTADGWFNTGDLGFLKNGCLTITGRQKDVIIINGLNYYSHEMESVVEELPEIEVSYTAACALRETNSNTDKLGIFFNSSKTEDTELLGLLKTLREQIVNRMGINPDYLIPLDKDLIPKTSIGKIQRTQLSQRFAKGEFQEVLKRVDLITENSNTIPDWFYEKTWQRKQGNYHLQKLAKIGVFLVFIDKLGLGQKFCQKLENNSQAYVQIELGETFKKINENHYIIGPDVREDYQQLYQDLGAENLQIGAIIHLWHYDKYTGEITDTETLERAQKTGIYSLLFILQTFGNQKENEPVRLLYVASQSQSLEAKELMAYEKATVPGLLKTIPQENPEWDCRHLDLPQESLEVNSNRILEELTIDAKDSEVAYRDGERWVSGIKKINLPSLPLQPLPFKAGGIYLISGGLGGIGVEIAKYLLENYQAKLLLLGRTPLPERNSWEIYLQQGGKLAEKIKTYQQLQKLGGEVIYQGVDIGHQKAVQDVVQQTLSGWDVQQLDGVIHLAGSYHESLLKDETKQSLATLLNPKVQGAWILYQLVQKQPSTLFLNFSSAIGVFGGVIVGAYASSNSFLENLTYYQRYQGGLHSYCFAWTTWSKTGMSKGYQMKYITRSQGYSDMSISQGMSSMLAGLCRNQPQLIVGLDGSNINIRRFTSTSDSLQQLTAYFTINGKGKPNVSVMDLPVQDAVGKPSSCSVVELPEMPLTKDGDIDIGLLSESNLGRSTQEIVKPGNDTEKKITTIWKEVLQTEKVGIYDNFFELGGKSVLLIQVYGKLQKIFDINLKVVDLLANPTVHSLSEFIINGGAAELNKQSQITHEKRVSKRLSKKSERGNIRKKLRTI